MKRCSQTLFACLLALVTTHAQPAAASSLETAMEAMAKEIASFFTESSIPKKVLVRNFSGPSDVGTGRRVSNELVKQLGLKGVVRANALESGDLHRIDGKFSFNPETQMIAISAFLHDKNNEEVMRFRERVHDQEIKTASDLLGLLPSSGIDFQKATKPVVEDFKRRSKLSAKPASAALSLSNKIKDSIADGRDGTTFDVRSETRIAGSSESPFEMQIAVLQSNQPKAAAISKLGGGKFAFVPLAEGDVYEVRLYNHADHDVSVELNIDGVNTLSLSENLKYREKGRWVIGRKVNGRPGSGVIRGWHRNDGFSNRFLVTAEENGVAHEIGAPSDPIGSVQAIFYHAWDAQREPPPAIELAGKPPGNNLNVATGTGALVSVRTTPVVRMHGVQPLATVAIRYENPDVSDLPEDLPPE